MTTANRPQNLQVIATGTGPSAEIVLPYGRYMLYFRAATWGSGLLKLIEGGGVNALAYPFNDADRAPIVIAANEAMEVPGGQRYVLDVTAFVSPITIRARLIGRA